MVRGTGSKPELGEAIALLPVDSTKGYNVYKMAIMGEDGEPKGWLCLRDGSKRLATCSTEAEAVPMDIEEE